MPAGHLTRFPVPSSFLLRTLPRLHAVPNKGGKRREGGTLKRKSFTYFFIPICQFGHDWVIQHFWKILKFYFPEMERNDGHFLRREEQSFDGLKEQGRYECKQ